MLVIYDHFQSQKKNIYIQEPFLHMIFQSMRIRVIYLIPFNVKYKCTNILTLIKYIIQKFDVSGQPLEMNL